jgi:hypothetical protein
MNTHGDKLDYTNFILTNKIKIGRIVPETEYYKIFNKYKFNKKGKPIQSELKDLISDKDIQNKNKTIYQDQKAYGIHGHLIAR